MDYEAAPPRQLTLDPPPLTIDSPALMVGDDKSGVRVGVCRGSWIQISLPICRQDIGQDFRWPRDCGPMTQARLEGLAVLFESERNTTAPPLVLKETRFRQD